MKINQLFKTHVPEDLMYKLAECFGYNKNNFNEDLFFSKIDLDNQDTVHKVEWLKDEIAKYYLPCKAKLYLTNLDNNKCITLLRQILRLHGYVLLSKQKYVKQKKTTFYYIQKMSVHDTMNHCMAIRIDSNPRIISFL